MSLVFVGADFFDAPQTLLDAGEKHSDQLREKLRQLGPQIEGFVVLATCNRIEIYADTQNVPTALQLIISDVAEVLGESSEKIAQVFRVLSDAAAVRHLFSVTAGLESMVMGEAQIAGQVRASFAKSQRDGVTTKRLNLLFQRAQRVSKKIWSTTDVGQSGRSIAHTALDLAQQSLPLLPPKSVLIIGTGAYARVAVAALKKMGVGEILVFSRSGRAEQFAASHGLTPITEGDLPGVIATVDIIFSASGQHGNVLTSELVRRSLSDRVGSSELVIIDVALSLDVDPRVASLTGCTLISLDTLRMHAPRQHSETLRQVDEMLSRETVEFEAEESARAIDPVVSALRIHINEHIEREIREFQRQAGPLNFEDASRRIANAILHTPSVRAKELASQGQHGEYLRAVQVLFGLEVALHESP